MITVTSLSSWLDLRRSFFNKTLGLVATMGNLHAGHISLCKKSQLENDLTVVSIFINPTQFNDDGDLQAYKAEHDLEQDKAILSDLGIDILLLPTADMMYADNYQIRVMEIGDSAILEGRSRPGHFTGVLTVVAKILNLTAPARAYFGEKDYQQYLLVDKMAKALMMPSKIIPCPTIRTAQGLAYSSRNARLNPDQLLAAVMFAKILAASKGAAQAYDDMIKAGFDVDYVEDRWSRRLAAINLAGIRLIDNIPLPA